MCTGLNDPSTLFQIIGLHLAISEKSAFEPPGWISVGVVNTSAVAALLSSSTKHPKSAPRFEHAHGCDTFVFFSLFHHAPFANIGQLFYPGLAKFAPVRSAPTCCYQDHDVIQSVLWTLVLCGIFALSSSALALFLLLGLSCCRRGILCVCQSQVFLYSYSKCRLNRLFCPSSFVKFGRICHDFIHLNEESQERIAESLRFEPSCPQRKGCDVYAWK